MFGSNVLSEGKGGKLRVVIGEGSRVDVTVANRGGLAGIMQIIYGQRHAL